MSSQGCDREFILKLIQDKFEDSFQYFMGNGPLASSMYIDSQVYSAKEQNIKTFDELYKVFLSNDSNSKSNLIVGDSGLGKTTFGLHICQKFWTDYAHNQIDIENDRIPIYIHLPSVAKSVRKNILYRFLRKNTSHVESVAKLKLLLILDGFDELSERNENIFRVNRWGYPPYRDVRVVILSRHEIPQSHKTGLFEFIQEGAPTPSVTSDSSKYSEYVIQPFNLEQISGYIDGFDSFILSNGENELRGSMWEMTKVEYTQHGWSKEDYWKWFNRFRDLKSLAQTPLILSLIMQTLPKVCRGGLGSSETDILRRAEKFCKTKVGVFDGFTESWFYFQYKRLVKAGRLTDFRIRWPVFMEFCYAFGQNVAYSMICRSRDESRGLLQENSISRDILDSKFLEVNGNDYSVSPEIQSECIEILKSSQNIPQLLESVRIACLIKYSQIELSRSERTLLISFFHRSLAEYFVSRDLFKGLAGEFNNFLTNTPTENLNVDENVRGLNSYLLKEEGIIVNLADRVKSESNLKKTLFSIVYESRNVSLISIMSANAISILNIAGVSLSGLDFSWVQIPGANLNHSICGNTNFNGANLQNASFENAWLFGAQLKGANLEGTRFGIIPNIPIQKVWDKTFIQIEIHQENENWFLYGGNISETPGCIKIAKWDLLTLEKVKEYTTACNNRMTEFRFCFNFWNEKYLCVWQENLILFELDSGEELARVGIPTHQTLVGENELPWHGQIFGFAYNYFRIAWGNLLKIFRIDFIPGTKNILQLTLKGVSTIEFPRCIPSFLKDFFKTSTFQMLNKVMDFVYHVEFGLVARYLNVIEFVDKGFKMTFDEHMIIAYDIDSRKRRIVIAGHLGSMEIWTIDSKIRLKRLRPTSDFTAIVIFSPDSKYLVSGSVDRYGNSVSIWDNENDWSILDVIQIGKDIPFTLRLWSTNEGRTTIAISTPQSIQLYPINGNEHDSNCQIINKMTTQKKFAEPLQCISCSIDGNFVATMSRVRQPEEEKLSVRQFQETVFKGSPGHKLFDYTPLFQSDYKSKMKEFFRISNPIILYTIQVSNTLTGTKEYEFGFPLENGSGLMYMTFFLNNRILCIGTTGEGTQGTTFSLIFDLEGNVLKNRTRIKLSNCRFYSTQLNSDGTLIAFLLSSGQIKLFKLKERYPYIQEWGCIPNSTVNSNHKPVFVSFNLSRSFLTAVSVDHGHDNTSVFKNVQMQIWDVQNESVNLINEFHQPHSTPISFPSSEYLIPFDLTIIRSRQGDLCLSAQLKRRDTNTVNIIQPFYRQEMKDILEIYFWFKIKFLKFIPQGENNRASTCTKLVVSDGTNLCCLEMGLNDESPPTWLILWSFCSNVNLVLRELSLNGCISLEESVFHNLRRLGAHPNGSMACNSQEYISKSNLICPILGSSDLALTSILGCENSESLSPSNENWILSVIGKKTRVPLKEGLVEIKCVSHVFLALEGLKRGRRFITEAHLYVSHSKTYFVLRPVRDLERFRVENEGCSVKQWYRTRRQGELLLDDILLDYQNHWEYKFLTYNCVTWCKRKLKNNGIEFKNRIWDKLIVTPSAVLGRERVFRTDDAGIITPNIWFCALIVLVLAWAIMLADGFN